MGEVSYESQVCFSVKVFQEKQAHRASGNEAAALILHHSAVTPGVTPTVSCLAVLRVDLHAHTHTLPLFMMFMLSSSVLLFWCLTAETRSTDSAYELVLHLIYAFKSRCGGYAHLSASCWKHVERFAKMSRIRTLNWLMTLSTPWRTGSTLSPSWVKPLQFTSAPLGVSLPHWLEHTGFCFVLFFPVKEHYVTSFSKNDPVKPPVYQTSTNGASPTLFWPVSGHGVLWRHDRSRLSFKSPSRRIFRAHAGEKISKPT